MDATDSKSKNASARKEALERYDQAVQKDGDSYENDTVEIVKILGGIDRVIHDYLSPDNDRLSSHQISRLRTLFATPPNYRSANHKNRTGRAATAISHDNDAAENNKVAFDVENEEYELNAYETYLNRCFGPKRVEKIDSILTNFWFKFILFCSIFGLLAVYMAFDVAFDGSAIALYVVIVSFVLWIPYNVVFLLSANPSGFHYLILHGFEFWMRFFYVLYGYWAALWYYFGILTFDEYEYPTLQMLACVCLGVCICLLLCVVTMSDVIYMPEWGKRLLALLMPVVTTYIWISLQFFTIESQSEDECHDDSFVSVGGKGFSLNAVMVTAFNVLAVLLWKQWILESYRKVCLLTQQSSSFRKGQAVVVKRNPIIVWIKKEKKKKSATNNNVAKAYHDSDSDDDVIVATTTVHKKFEAVGVVTSEDEVKQVEVAVEPGNEQTHDVSYSMSSIHHPS